MNAAYRHWARIGWAPAFYACLDEVVGLSHAKAIGAMVADAGRGAPASFLLRGNLVAELGLAKHRAVTNFDALAAVERAYGRTPVTTGSHAVIWAAAMGRRAIFLLGADADYVERVPGAEDRGDGVLQIVRRDDNPNYFFDDYQRPGDRFHTPNIGGATHLRAWRVAAAVAAEAGACVYNLSPVSRIDVFPRLDLDTALAWGGAGPPPPTRPATPPPPPPLSQDVAR